MTKLFDMKSDGRNFTKLSKGLLGYKGATILLIKHEENNTEYIFGAYKSNPWKDSHDY